MNRESRIVQCGACGAKNRIPAEKLGQEAKCGKCGRKIDTTKVKSPSESERKSSETEKPYLVRCVSCGAKNRIPPDKMGQAARCGKCRETFDTAGLLSGRSMMVTDRDFETRVLQSPLPVLFFCFANWCPSCQSVIPIVEQLARQWKGRVRVAKLNVDQNQVTAAKFNIMSVPTIMIFDGGQMKERLTGAVPQTQITSAMAPYI